MHVGADDAAATHALVSAAPVVAVPAQHPAEGRLARAEPRASAMVLKAGENTPGRVRHARSYTLKPGMAHVYNEGDVHSPRREGPTRLIRIEGKNMDKVRRLSYARA